MASSARIEELQKKFDENPRRYFAPLANEYRKAGDIDQAIFICQEYLPQQPGHMSGHIVYGQALYEAKRLDESKAVFETALSLDPENLIALRHLGDIARDQGDIGGAQTWYQRVLDADPRNEEIAGLIAALPAPGDQYVAAPAASDQQADGTPAAPAAEATGEAKIERAPAENPLADFAAEMDEVEAAPPQAPPPQTPPPEPPVPEAAASAQSADDGLLDIETSELPPEDLPVAPEAASASDAAAPLSAPLADEFSLAFDSGIPGANAEPAAPSEPPQAMALDGLEATHAGPVSSGTAEVAPLDGLDVVDTGVVGPAVEFAAPIEPPPPVIPPPAPASPAPFVTETMAELYLQQGHRDEAIAVYRQLIAEHPDDSGLRDRLSGIETSAVPAAMDESPVARATIHDVLAALAAYRPRSAAMPPLPEPASATPVDAEPASMATATSIIEPIRVTPSASQPTVGGSIDALFSGAEAAHEDETAAATLAGAFVDAPAPVPEPEVAPNGAVQMTDEDIAGEPARHATDELSLDVVFREPTPARGQEAGGVGFSFDQFFSGSASDRASGATPEEGTPAAPQGAPDDIEQFNAWLEGLKKS